MAIVTLPMRPDLPNYGFQVDLEGVSYGFVFRWNDREGSWYFDLLDGEGVTLRAGVKLVLDFPLFLSIASARRPPGQLFAVDTSNTGAEPGAHDLGVRIQLVYYESSEFPGS